jgi:hypothetical protein
VVFLSQFGAAPYYTLTLNCLFFVPSPRDIDIVSQKIKEILYPDYDVLWIKYAPELEAYRKAREFFLKSPKKYEYFCIVPDDLILNPESFDMLLKEVSTNNYKVLSGICNVSCQNHQYLDMAAATLTEMPTATRIKWVTFPEAEKFDKPIKKVIFAGFPVTFIHRSVMEKIDFTRNNPINSLDLELAYALEEEGIDQYCHFGAKFLHLKGANPLEFLFTLDDMIIDDEIVEGGKRIPKKPVHRRDTLPNVELILVGIKKKKAVFHSATKEPMNKKQKRDLVIPIPEPKKPKQLTK